MKNLQLFLLVCCCFIAPDLFAQSPKAIEADLLKAFKKMDFDSLGNEDFGSKLQKAVSKYPFTITYPFDSLTNHLGIISSGDGRFRIYSWDTDMGGTQHFFENVIQYKTGSKTYGIYDAIKEDGESRPNYDKIYFFKINNKTYYLTTYTFVRTLNEFRKGIQIFTIEHDTLNNNVKLIRTKSGLHSQLSYDYHISTIEDYNDSGISFDASTKTITLPVVNENGVLTDKFITYKFTGQYFEKVKS